MKVCFVPKYRKVAQLSSTFSQEDIKQEPMLFSCDYSFARSYGGDLTNLILDQLLSDPKFCTDLYENPHKLVIDTRVNMLTRGIYPSIPGWHCDDVPRQSRLNQPDFTQISEGMAHYIVVLSDKPNISGTEFITSTHTFKLDPKNVWFSLNKSVNKAKIQTRKLVSGEVLEFNPLAIHRATPAKHYGWRLFFRASFTYRKPVNEIRNQTQVYCDVKNAGW